MTVKLTYPGRDITKKKYSAFQQECLALLTVSQIVRSFFLLSMFNYMLYLTELSSYRAGHIDGTTACCSLS